MSIHATIREAGYPDTTTMTELSEAIPEYCTSEHFMFLDDAVKEHAETLLQQWCDLIEEPVTAASVADSLTMLGRIEIPRAAKRAFPDLLRQFLEFASSTGRAPQAADWVEHVDEAEEGFVVRIRDDGTVRGITRKKASADVGRNDPCPCGSGKKFKKCCIGFMT